MTCKCNHVFTKYYWDTELDLVYSEDKNGQGVGGKLDHQRETGLEICRIMAQKVPKGTWVDLGCGNGAQVFSADEFGYTAVGVDLRKLPVYGLNQLGYSAEQANCLEIDYSGVDIVSMGDLLEHLPFPKEFLQKLYNEGVKAVYISCPTMDSATWRALDKQGNNGYWVEYEHHHNFTKARLEALLEEVGFTPFYYGTRSRYYSNMEIFACRS
jgi:hypothetical protein